jgi:hypothetical protein
VNRATRLGALVLACAACAHRTAPPDPPAYGTPDYEVPATAPGRSAAPPTGPSASPGPGGAASSNAARLASIRSSVEQTLARQAKLLWETWTRGAPPDLDASLARREPLFSAETAAQTLAFVKGERDRAANEDRRALSLLYAFLLGEHLSDETAPAKAPPQSMLTWNGRAVATTQVPMLLSAEPDPARRAALEHAWAEAGRRRGAAEEARWRSIAAAATRVGYGSLPALATELRGEPAEALAALARGVLGATETTYRALLLALAREEMGAEPSRLRGRDLPRLLRVSEDARAFPAGRAAADVGETMAAIGLDLERRPGVVLDLAARPGKDPRPLALPVEVPGSVRVSFAPQGGAAELRALLHEMGAATFYAHVTTPVLEFRRLGTVTAECWAFLFEDLAGDPNWLSERTKLADSHLTPVVRAAAARRLHAARTLAARILVEIEREREPGEGRPGVRLRPSRRSRRAAAVPPGARSAPGERRRAARAPARRPGAGVPVEPRRLLLVALEGERAVARDGLRRGLSARPGRAGAQLRRSRRRRLGSRGLQPRPRGCRRHPGGAGGGALTSRRSHSIFTAPPRGRVSRSSAG